FQAPISNLTYTVGGVPTATAATYAYFYNTGSTSLGICLDAGCFLGFLAATSLLYSGPESAPTILPGTYIESQLLFAAPPTVSEPPGVITITAGAPEPSAFW